MSGIAPHRLEHAVAAICPDIEARVASCRPELNERRLWWELSCCLLSSQVPFSLAVAAADAIDRHLLLLDEAAETTVLMPTLADILSQPLSVNSRHRFYRFPTVRANHLAATRVAVTRAAGSLGALLVALGGATEVRAWFVGNAPGIGPKQASMFLRNAGISYDLAILDRHVLNYMAALDLYRDTKRPISGLAQYRHHEATLRSHADDMGFAVGLLDWAIWIVMRAARRTHTELVVV